jgi:hypothetical protein
MDISNVKLLNNTYYAFSHSTSKNIKRPHLVERAFYQLICKSNKLFSFEIRPDFPYNSFMNLGKFAPGKEL